jgi:uncharacterized protein YpmS
MPGRLGIKTVTPDNIESEWGFTWNAQLYYSGKISTVDRAEFRKLIDVYLEDVEAVEKIKEPYRVVFSNDPFEKQNVHFGEWIQKVTCKR